MEGYKNEHELLFYISRVIEPTFGPYGHFTFTKYKVGTILIINFPREVRVYLVHIVKLLPTKGPKGHIGNTIGEHLVDRYI